MSREAIEERGVFGYTENLNDQYVEKNKFAMNFRLKVIKRDFVESHLRGITIILFSVGSMFVLIKPAIDGVITIGMFIALMEAVFGLSNKLSWGIHGLIKNISEKQEFLKDLTEFMRLEEHEDATSLPDKKIMFKTLEFKNVSFKYPGTEKLILNDVSFKIEFGKHYSFVGVNGAGKTTIIKLITGLYTNYTGEIYVDGRSLRDLTQSEIKGLSSVVYQDFAKYYITLYDNLIIADLDENNAVEDLSKRTKAQKAIELVGLSDAVAKLKGGIDTPLGKIVENGIDLSGGEWQRLAFARSVMSTAPLKILDEPTAALDPLSESRVYRNFEQISRGMTTIFISHRLGSTKLADVIYVLSNGKIAESGSHSKLMSLKGIYWEMFNSQAEWYRSEDEKEDPINE